MSIEIGFDEKEQNFRFQEALLLLLSQIVENQERGVQTSGKSSNPILLGAAETVIEAETTDPEIDEIKREGYFSWLKKLFAPGYKIQASDVSDATKPAFDLSVALTTTTSAVQSLTEAIKGSNDAVSKTPQANVNLNITTEFLKQTLAASLKMNRITRMYDSVTDKITRLGEAAAKFPKENSEAIMRMNTMFDKSAKSVKTMSLSLIGLGAAIMILSNSDTEKGLKTLLIIGTSLVALTLAFDKFSGTGPKQIKDFAVSVAILSGSIALLSNVVGSSDGVIKAIGGMLGAMMVLVVGLTQLEQLGFKNKVKNFNSSIISFTVGVAGLTLAMSLASQIPINLKGIMTVVAVTGALAGAMALVSHFSKDIKGGTVLMLTIVATVALIPMLADLYDDTKTSSLLKMMLVVGTIAGGVALIGRAKTTWAGVAMITAITGSLYASAKAMNIFNDVEWTSIAKAGVTIAGMVTMASLIGSIISSGVGALVLGGGLLVIAGIGGSLYALGKGMQAIPDVSEDRVKSFTNGVSSVAKMFVEIGAMTVTSFGSLPLGIGTATGIGFAISKLANGFKAVQGFNVSDATEGATKLVSASKIIINELASMFGDEIKDFGNWFYESLTGQSKFAKAIKGIDLLGKLGTALSLTAAGVIAMANGNYNEMKVINGRPTVVAIHKLNDDDFERVGEGIGKLINSLAEPLAQFGKGGWGFIDSDIEDGIEAMTGLGNAIGSTAEGVIAMSNGTFNEYTVENGKRKLVKVHKLDESTFERVGLNLGALIKTLAGPLAEFGSGGGWFGLADNDIKKGMDAIQGLGNVITPIVKLVEHKDELESLNPEVFNTKLSELIRGKYVDGKYVNGLQDTLKTVADAGFWSNDFETGFEALSGLTKIIEPIKKLGEIKAESLNTDNFTTAVGNLVTRLKPSMLELSNTTSNVKDNLMVLQDTAKALDTIANSDLSALVKLNEVRRHYIVEKLDEIITAIGMMGNSNSKVVSGDTVVYNSNGSTVDIDIEDVVTIETISEQLNDIMTILRVRR